MRQRGILLAACAFLCCPLAAQVKRIVVLKVDGVPAEVLEREVQRIDPVTRKSTLPWIQHIFRSGGTSVPNFYVRAISLSAPSWSMLDTGQHLEIRGNAEFDRYTGRVYDYLNFFPFYIGYALSRRVDMPGVEVLDDLKIPLLIDRFPYPAVYQGPQLYQRGVSWTTLKRSLARPFSGSFRDLLDEWTIGLEMGSSVEQQAELELKEKLGDPSVQYLDYFTGDYDHAAHASPDPEAQRLALRRIDALVGRVWTAIEASPLAAQTVLVLISDHGMNTQPGVYSQGYDLVKFFNSREGGAQHVLTNRNPMTEYKLKGLDPMVSEVVTPSEESTYLNGAANDYPTVMLDLDGNERASVYLRNSDWNALQVLLNQLDRRELAASTRRAGIAAFFRIIDMHRSEWGRTAQELRLELAALRDSIEELRVQIQSHPFKETKPAHDAGLDKAARRLNVQLESWREQERSYTAYADALDRMLALTPADFEKRRIPAADLIPRRVMSDRNSVHDLQNYVVGPSAAGLVHAPDGSLDFERSFERLDYFSALAGRIVRNNVQAAVGSRPIDFLALRIASEDLPGLDAEEAIWLYGNQERQALILSRHDAAGDLELRYVPVRGLRQAGSGAVRFDKGDWLAGYPLHLWEDGNFGVAASERAAWLDGWHSDLEWLRVAHGTRYSDAVIALQEQFSRRKETNDAESSSDLMQRFRGHKRLLTEPDFVIFANDHWNFNVRGFNPGGNHGSFFRISTRSVLLAAGGAQTGIAHGLVVEEPYDSLSFVPTMLELMQKSEDARELPGRPIKELLKSTANPAATQ